MGKPRFTSGKWTAFVRRDTKTFAVLKNGDPREPIVEWTGFDAAGQPPGEKAANCYLMAASKDLYKAAEDAVRAIEAPSGLTDWMKLRNQLDAALAKARGETNGD